jgi:hypothetical protein
MMANGKLQVLRVPCMARGLCLRATRACKRACEEDEDEMCCVHRHRSLCIQYMIASASISIRPLLAFLCALLRG